MGGIWVCGVEAGVGGLRSPPSAIELLVDCGVWGPCKEPDPAVELRDAWVQNRRQTTYCLMSVIKSCGCVELQ